MQTIFSVSPNHVRLRRIVAIPFVCVLGACNGAMESTGNEAPTGSTAPTQTQPLTSDVKDWIGVMVTSNGTPILTQERVTGTATTSSGQITIQTANGTFTSTGGPNSNGVYTDANGNTASPIDSALISGSYGSMVPLVLSRNVNGTNVVSTGVFGEPTPTSVMSSVPANATYTGEAAIVSQNTISGAVRHRSANTVITVDFNGNTVGATMSGITVPAGVAATLDQVTLAGATISGNGFSGGTVTATLGGANALPNITNGGETTNVAGNFFGTDVSGTRPDEVGGSILIEGNNGSVSATFVAD